MYKAFSIVGPKAPGLPNSLKMPRRIEGPFDFAFPFTVGNLSTEVLLVHLGLNHLEALGLCFQVFQLVPKETKFKAEPNNAKLPSVSDSKFPLLERFDIYWAPTFNFASRINFCAPDSQIIADFAKWLQMQRRALRLPRWGYKARNPKKFTRDLVVAVLSEDREWSVDFIEKQLSFLGLPAITAKKDARTKDARRKILCEIRALIRSVKGRRSLLLPSR